MVLARTAEYSGTAMRTTRSRTSAPCWQSAFGWPKQQQRQCEQKKAQLEAIAARS